MPWVKTKRGTFRHYVKVFKRDRGPTRDLPCQDGGWLYVQLCTPLEEARLDMCPRCTEHIAFDPEFMDLQPRQQHLRFEEEV